MAPLKAGKIIKTPPDINEFIARAKPILAEAGYTLRVHDKRFLRPEGAEASEYVTVNEERDDRWFTKQYRGGFIAELIRTQCRVRLFIAGPNERALHFELRDSNDNVQRFDHVDATILDKMVERVDALASTKVKNALNLRRSFKLL